MFHVKLCILCYKRVSGGKVDIMANKKNYWYVVVMTDNGPVFVTGVNNMERTAYWNKDQKPLELGKEYAQSLATGLMLNFHFALPVCNTFELTEQCYNYKYGHFEWLKNEEQDN